MRLSEARLCLDCDEVHSDAHCPVCASESFAFIKRWVTTPERRAKSSATPPPDTSSAETVATYRALLASNGDSRMSASSLLRGGAMGLALLGAAGWFLHRTSRDDKNGTSTPAPPSEPSTDSSDQSSAA